MLLFKRRLLWTCTRRPENFLLSDPSETGVIQTCDFGLSTFFKVGHAACS
jgi:hypothetical protein